MKRNVIVDGHCDSLSRAYDQKMSLEDGCLMFNLKMANEVKPYIQFLASYIGTRFISEDMSGGYERGVQLLDYFDTQFQCLQHQYPLIQILDQNTLEKAIEEQSIGLLLSSENGAIFSRDVANVRRLYERGIRVMGITWNDDNLLGSGALTKCDQGLTTFGKECIQEMNQLSVCVDVSHLSNKSFWDTAAIANHMMATHSGVEALCHHPRNLTDAQIKEIARRDSVIGICFYTDFLVSGRQATIDDVIHHIIYIADLVGVEYVGLGSDFDGIEREDLPIGIRGVQDMDCICHRLVRAGFSYPEIQKMMGGNMIRVLKQFLH